MIVRKQTKQGVWFLLKQLFFTITLIIIPTKTWESTRQSKTRLISLQITESFCIHVKVNMPILWMHLTTLSTNPSTCHIRCNLHHSPYCASYPHSPTNGICSYQPFPQHKVMRRNWCNKCQAVGRIQWRNEELMEPNQITVDGLSSQVMQRATELDHGSLSVVGFFFCYKVR